MSFRLANSGDKSLKCCGDACAVVSIEWDERSRMYLVGNTSDRSILVSLGSWAAHTEIRLGPHESKHFQGLAFEYPYSAVFVA